MYQRVTILGHLGRAVELRYSSSGDAVASFSVATSRTWKDSNGQQQERVVWFKISAWKALGEACNQYLGKGSKVYIEGELREPKPYQARDGSWKASLDVTARLVKFLSPKGEVSTQSVGEQSAGGDGDGIEELPF